MHISNVSIHDLVATLAGIGGGAVALIRSAKKRKKPIHVGQIFGSLFVSAFAAYLVALLLPQTLNNDVRTAVCGIAGMSGNNVLDILESSWLDYIKFKAGGRDSRS